MAKVKVEYEFDIELFDTNKSTESKRWYSSDTIAQIDAQIKSGKEFIVQEYCPLEREIKHIRLDSVWEERIMGKITSSTIKDGKLYVHVRCVDGRYGKKLMSICENMGLDSVKFYPIGYGNTATVGGMNVVTNYTLIYVAF